MKASSAVLSGAVALVLAFGIAQTTWGALVGLWRFDEGTGTTVVDSSLNGLDGYLSAQGTSSHPEWIAGRSGLAGDTALRFGADGSRNMMVADYQPVMDNPSGTGEITMAAWISSEEVNESLTPGTEWGRLFQRWEVLMYMDKLSAIDSLSMTINMGWPDPAPFVDVYDKTETAVPVSANSSTAPEWTHVAVTFDGTDMKLYVDGALKYTNNHPGIIRGDYYGPVNVGNRYDLHGEYDRQFVGAMDDVAYFDTALTPAELSTVMSGDFSSFMTPPSEGAHLYGTVVKQLDPSHHYSFGTPGVIAYDSGVAATPVDGVLKRYHGGAGLNLTGPTTSDGLPGFATSPGNGAMGPRTLDVLDVGSLELSAGTDWDEEQMTFSGWVGLPIGTGLLQWDRIFTNSQEDNNFQIIIHDEDELNTALDGLYITTNDTFFGNQVVKFLPKTSLNLVDEQWHHLLVTRDGDGGDAIKVMVDGVDVTSLLATSSETLIVGNPEGIAFIGGIGPDQEHGFTGLMDEVSIWVGQALTMQDGIDLYSAADGSITLIPGDANVDGVVDALDAAVLADHWNESDAGWVMGDFNGDGSVDMKDASILAANWGAGGTESVVPEPSVLALLCMGAVALLGRRRS